eukprot:10463138-Ditylum_brightwellii.AAC.1
MKSIYLLKMRTPMFVPPGSVVSVVPAVLWKLADVQKLLNEQIEEGIYLPTHTTIAKVEELDKSYID